MMIWHLKTAIHLDLEHWFFFSHFSWICIWPGVQLFVKSAEKGNTEEGNNNNQQLFFQEKYSAPILFLVWLVATGRYILCRAVFKRHTFSVIIVIATTHRVFEEACYTVFTRWAKRNCQGKWNRVIWCKEMGRLLQKTNHRHFDNISDRSQQHF